MRWRTTSLLTVLALASLAAPARSCAYVSGGTTTFRALGLALANLSAAPSDRDNPAVTYVATPSAAEGVNNFTADPENGLCTVVADSPFTAAQEARFANVYPNQTASVTAKFTMPLVVAAFGFFVSAPSGTSFSLTARDTFNLFYKGGTWKQKFLSARDGVSPVSGPFSLNTAVTPIQRLDPAGATELIKRFWVAADKTIGALQGILNSDGDIDGSPLPPTFASAKRQLAGATSICAVVARVLGAITYSQQSLCTRNGGNGLVEVALKNAAGAYVASSGLNTQLSQAFFRIFPAAGADWSAFSTVFRPGQYTPPIVTLQYLFARKSYMDTGEPIFDGALLLSFITYSVNNAGALAPNYGFTPVPASLVSQNKAAAAEVQAKTCPKGYVCKTWKITDSCNSVSRVCHSSWLSVTQSTFPGFTCSLAHEGVLYCC